jgi:hypothetical protein
MILGMIPYARCIVIIALAMSYTGDESPSCENATRLSATPHRLRRPKYPPSETHQRQPPPRVFTLQAEHVLLERDEAELELLHFDRAEHAQVGEQVGAQRSHSGDSQQVEDVD